MSQSLHTESLHAAMAESRRTLALLHLEADALSRKGMCQDDFEFYAQRLTELEQHLAYLLHLEGLVLAAVPFVPAVSDYEEAALADAPCDHCADVRKHALRQGRTDADRIYCSEGCWELATAPAYYNARTEPLREPSPDGDDLDAEEEALRGTITQAELDALVF